MQPQADHAETDTAEYLTFDEMASRFYENEPRTTIQAEFGARTHPGKVRESNEDQYLVVRRRRVREVVLTSMPPELLFQPEQTAYTLCVADGMGGHAFGELASFLALRTGWELGAGEVKWSVKMNDRESKEMMKKAEVFFRLIDRTLRDVGEEQPRLRNMGTTLTVCYVTGPELFVIHAGDSRAYLYRDGELRRLTRDHTLAQSMIDAGVAEEGSPEERRRRHILTNCIGGPDLALDVDVDHHRLTTGDRLLLCTDGLTKHLDDPEIVTLLERHTVPEDACRALVDLALERGGRDNVTVVLGRFAFPGPAEEFPVTEPGVTAEGPLVSLEMDKTMRSLHRGVLLSLVTGLLSLVLYVGYALTVAVGAVLSNVIAAIGAAALCCGTALILFFLLVMASLCDPVDYAWFFLYVLLAIFD